MTLNAKRIYQSIYFHRLPLSDVLSIICLYGCLLPKFEGVLRCLFYHRNRMRKPKTKIQYTKVLNTKDKSKKTKVKMQKTIKERNLSEDKIRNIKGKIQKMRYNAKDKSQNNKKYISTYITPAGVLFFSSSTGLDPAFTVQHPPPKKKEISGISNTLKICEILATPKNIPILYLDPKKKI